MNSETLDIVWGVLIVAVALPVLYFAARLATKIGQAWSARILAPLAPVLGSVSKLSAGALRGIYKGCDLRAFYAKNKNDGWDDTNSVGFNAFYIEAMDLPGRHNWSIKFHVSGLLGQGPKELFIHAADSALSERLAQTGVIAAVAKVSTPSEDYVTVAYDAGRKVLTYSDDVSPRSVPTPQQFLAQLDLVARLAVINTEVNWL
jgi:Tol biopolymer transport system component